MILLLIPKFQRTAKPVFKTSVKIIGKNLRQVDEEKSRCKVKKNFSQITKLFSENFLAEF